ncbi:TRAP transporter small permease [Hoeflea sp.]|uniref:TRAP transporter small permease n=1 Tax=Hoeflea sp. TaxID=1940281 RepID=UPI003B016A87
MSTTVRWARRLTQIPVLLACAALFILMAMTFADVILRSAFNAPIEAATELTRMLMAIVVFSVLPVLSVRGGHIVVDLLDPFYRSALVERIRDAAISLICGAMLVLPAERVLVLAERARSYGDLTEYLNIPQFYIGWFIAIMTYLTAFVLLVRGTLMLFAPKLLEDSDA